MKSQQQIEMLSKVGSDGFFNGVLSYVLSGVATAIILKIVWSFCAFIKWIFFTYPYLKAEIDKGLTEGNKTNSRIIKMESSLKKIEKKLGISDE